MFLNLIALAMDCKYDIPSLLLSHWLALLGGVSFLCLAYTIFFELKSCTRPRGSRGASTRQVRRNASRAAQEARREEAPGDLLSQAAHPANQDQARVPIAEAITAYTPRFYPSKPAGDYEFSFVHVTSSYTRMDSTTTPVPYVQGIAFVFAFYHLLCSLCNILWPGRGRLLEESEDTTL